MIGLSFYCLSEVFGGLVEIAYLLRDIISSEVIIRRIVLRLLLHSLVHFQGKQLELPNRVIGNCQRLQHPDIRVQHFRPSEKTNGIVPVFALQLQKAAPEISLEIAGLMADQLIGQLLRIHEVP